jgi:GT2 family glycosyltransferase
MNENEVKEDVIPELETIDIAEDKRPPAIKTMGIPVLNRGDLLFRCVTSVDSEIETLFIINNGRDKSVLDAIGRIESRDFENAAMFGSIRVESYKNLGCGPSWNRIIRTSLGAWLLVGNDIQFSPGDIEKIKGTLTQNPGVGIIRAMEYATFCLTEIGVQKVGLFDENFYPAYFEDNDHFRRMFLASGEILGVPTFNAIHGEAPNWGSCTINSDPVLQRKNAITFVNLRDYYIRKWGGEPGAEKFSKPYNQDVPLDYWEIDPLLAEKNRIF